MKMSKSWEIGAISGGLAGIMGAWLASDYDFSLLSIVLIGAFIGALVGVVFKLIKGKKK
jgi:NAD(P)H-hydrate repair Nnr-like enzyme with NAD(P)H-hydrate dehydratase domain